MSKEIISVEAEEVPIEQAIEKQFMSSLEKHEITKKLLEEKKDECLALKLNGQDKEAYTLIRETRLNQKTNRVVIEKICKKGREDATRTQKAWIALEKDYVKIISEGEDYLKGLEEEFESEQERIKAEAKRKQDESFIIRQAELARMGAVYQDGNFVINDVSFEAILIKESDDEVWETMKSKFNEQYLINEEKHLAEEKIKSEAAAVLEAQRLEQERKQKELEAREASIKQKEQEEIDRQKLVEQKAEEERKAQRRAKLDGRMNQLYALGMTFNFQHDCFMFQDVNIDNKTELCLWNDEEWGAAIKKITPAIEQRKKETEEKRLADIEEQKRIAAEEAVKKEQEKVAEAARQAEIKRQQDEEKKRKDMEASDDKTKWNNWLEEFKKLSPVPAMKSPAYRTKASIAREKIEEITSI